MISSSIEPSPTTSDCSSDELSVNSWRWESTLDSFWRKSDCPTTTTDEESSESSLTVSKIQNIVWKKKAMTEFILMKEKQSPLLGVKKILKKCASLISNPLTTFRRHEVYQIEQQRPSKFFNPVQLLTYTAIEDKLHPVEFVLNYLCHSVQDIHELRKNPQKIAHFIKGDIDVILQDAAFALAKMEQLNNAERRLRRFQVTSARRQKRTRQLDYIDPRF